jgi:hypothetical protein
MSEALVRAEVVRLHEFFDAWYAGTSGLRIEQFASAMDAEFTIVGPDGDIMGSDAIVRAVQTSFGKGGISIKVENFSVSERGTYVLCRYDEVHTSPDGETRRISTAVMEADDDTPGGYRWITVHETWAAP